MKKRLSILCALLLMVVGAAMAQTQVSGKVVSKEDGEPVIGATVLIDGTKTGTVTDMDGNFSISASKGQKLRISYLGTEPQIITVTGKPIRVELRSSDQSLSEVVVTALGIKREKKTLGYATQTVDAKDLTAGHVSDVTSALAGKVPGLTVSASTTDPGAANSVIIRGFSSINGSNQPLYIVDGVPLQQSSFSSVGQTTAMGSEISTGGISNIDPNDIASMTVLKGAAATALYGSRAGNGVVVITTKSGKKGNTRNFSIEYNGGFQWRSVATLQNSRTCSDRDGTVSRPTLRTDRGVPSSTAASSSPVLSTTTPK